MPSKCVQVGQQRVAAKARPWQMGGEEQVAQRVRQLFAQLLNCRPENVALTPSTSYAISAAAHNMRAQVRGRAVLVLADQMASNVLPWQNAVQHMQGELHVLKRPLAEHGDGIVSDWASTIVDYIEQHAAHEEALDATEQTASNEGEALHKTEGRRVGVVAIPNCHWSDGTMIDLQVGLLFS